MKPEDFYALVPRDELAERIASADTPAYLYFSRILERRLAELRSCFGDRFEVYYAVKANPNPAVLGFFAARSVGFDVASRGELSAVLRAGADAARVELTGPGKGEEELRAAVRAGVGCVNVESLSELELLARVAAGEGVGARVGIRIAPRSGAGGGIKMGRSSQFGIRAADLPEALDFIRAERDRLHFIGLHAHFGSQLLDPDEICNNYRSTLKIAAEIEGSHGPLEKVNLGGGLGVDYWDGQRPLDLVRTAEGVAAVLSEEAVPRSCRLIIEPGRFLVAEAGVFVVSVRHTKENDDRTFAIADGGINQASLLAGGIGQVLRRDYRHEVFCAPGASGAPAPAEPREVVLAGPLCLPQDVLLSRAAWPEGRRPRSNDRVCFFNCGAYGMTASPTLFLGHPPPRELLI